MDQTSKVAQHEVRVQASFRLPEELKKRAEHLVVDLGTTMQDLLMEALEKHVSHLESQLEKSHVK